MVFVTGSSRSGTTLMSRILNQHSSIFSFNELHYFEQLCSSPKLNVSISKDEALLLADRLLGIQKEGFLKYKNKGNYNEEAKKILECMASPFTSLQVYLQFVQFIVSAEGKQIGCDQTPRNILYIEEILVNIADAKVICLVRDPRSVLLSQKRKWKRKFLGASDIPYKESVRSYFNYHPYTISKLWSAAAKQALKWKNHHNVFFLKFEDLVDAPEQTVKSICGFLNLPFETGMLDVPHVGSSNKQDEKEAKRGIASSVKAAWKGGGLTSAELYICQQMNNNLMATLGYLPDVIPSKPYVQLFGQVLIFPVKMAVALLLNLNRVKNLKQAIKRRL